MERGVLARPKVQEALSRFELESLYIDEGDNAHLLVERFKSPTIPCYFLIDPQKDQLLAQQIGATTEEGFLDFLGSATK